MFKKVTNFVVNGIRGDHRLVLENKDELDTLLYKSSSKKFEDKLKKYGSNLVVPFFYIREALTKAIQEGDERIVCRCCRLKDNTEIDEDQAWSVIIASGEKTGYFYMKPPMHFAAQCGNSKIIRILAEYYSVSEVCSYLKDLNGYVIDAREHFLRPMHFVSTVDAVKCLSELGADINADSKNGTPFYRAVKSGNLEVIIALYEAGANINYIHPLYGSAFVHLKYLMHYNHEKYIPVLNLLCELGANPFEADSSGDIAISRMEYNVNSKPLFLYTFKSIFADITEVKCIVDGNLCLVNALKLSDKFNAIDDELVKKSLINFCSRIATSDKGFFKQVIPYVYDLGLVCRNFSNALFGTNFEIEIKASTFMPEEIILHISSQVYNIHPAFLSCIMRGNIVATKDRTID